jgi:hypothetical protein
LDVVDGGGIVLERLRARHSLYPQIAVHALFMMLFGVLNEFLELGCSLPVSFQLLVLREAQCLFSNYPLFLCVYLEVSELHL